MKLLFLLLLTGLYITGYSQVKLSGTYTLQCSELGEQYTFDSDSTFTYKSSGCSPIGTIGVGHYTINNHKLTLYFDYLPDTTYSFTYVGSTDSQSAEQCIAMHFENKSSVAHYNVYYFLANEASYRLSNTVAVDKRLCYNPATSAKDISTICIGNLNTERVIPLFKNGYNHHEYYVTLHSDTSHSLHEVDTSTFYIRGFGADFFYGAYDYTNRGFLFLKEGVSDQAKTKERMKLEGCTKEAHLIINR